MVGKNMGLVPDAVRNALQFAAYEMCARKHDRAPIRSDFCSGYVQTEGKTCVVGSRSGVLFNAFVEHTGGETPINFLLSQEEIDLGAEVIRKKFENEELGWSDDVPISEIPPALFEFRDVHPKALN